jgi:hypothetical protein
MSSGTRCKEALPGTALGGIGMSILSRLLLRKRRSRVSEKVHLSVAYDSSESENRVKYWEIIADNLKKHGWSLGWVSAIGYFRDKNVPIGEKADVRHGEK